MDTIGASMSQQLFALTGTTEPRAQDALDSATANEIGRDGNGGRRTDSTCSWPSVVGTGGLTLKETTDLLLFQLHLVVPVQVARSIDSFAMPKGTRMLSVCLSLGLDGVVAPTHTTHFR